MTLLPSPPFPRQGTKRPFLFPSPPCVSRKLSLPSHPPTQGCSLPPFSLLRRIKRNPNRGFCTLPPPSLGQPLRFPSLAGIIRRPQWRPLLFPPFFFFSSRCNRRGLNLDIPDIPASPRLLAADKMALSFPLPSLFPFFFFSSTYMGGRVIFWDLFVLPPWGASIFIGCPFLPFPFFPPFPPLSVDEE